MQLSTSPQARSGSEGISVPSPCPLEVSVQLLFCISLANVFTLKLPFKSKEEKGRNRWAVGLKVVFSFYMSLVIWCSAWTSKPLETLSRGLCGEVSWLAVTALLWWAAPCRNTTRNEAFHHQNEQVSKTGWQLNQKLDQNESSLDPKLSYLPPNVLTLLLIWVHCDQPLLFSYRIIFFVSFSLFSYCTLQGVIASDHPQTF